MKANKRQKLQRAGWQVGDTAEFLDLAPEEVAYIEMKLSLGQALREARAQKQMSQVEVASLISSSQSRVAKMEAGDASVTMDLLVKSLLAVGATPKDLAKCLSRIPN